MSGQTTTTTDPFQIVDEGASVTARKVFTRMGERLELTAETLGQSIRLDAIMLESVTWQEPEALADRGRSIDRSEALAEPPALTGPERDEPITISSEFAQAAVEKTAVEGRPMLAIEAPKLGYSVQLSAPALEWLAIQDHELFTEWLETPFGPGADDHEH